MSKWKTVGVVSNENMMVPHALQQRLEYDELSSGYEPTDEHRLLSVMELDGVE